MTFRQYFDTHYNINIRVHKNVTLM